MNRTKFVDMARDLEKQVEERTRDLKEALIKLEASEQIKRNFLANMSHELVTPLNHVIGFAEVLMDGLAGALNDKQKVYVDTIREAGIRLLAMLTNILDYIRIESGDYTPDLSWFMLRDLLAASISGIQAQAQSRGIRIELAIESGADVLIKSDPAVLGRILAQMLGNAVKFNKQQGRLSVRATLGKDFLGSGQNHAELIVADEGLGIRADDLDVIFSEFIQFEEPETKRHDGIGMGLALSRKLIEMLSGRVDVTSEPGKGSAFHIWVPVEFLSG